MLERRYISVCPIGNFWHQVGTRIDPTRNNTIWAIQIPCNNRYMVCLFAAYLENDTIWDVASFPRLADSLKQKFSLRGSVWRRKFREERESPIGKVWQGSETHQRTRKGVVEKGEREKSFLKKRRTGWNGLDCLFLCHCRIGRHLMYFSSRIHSVKNIFMVGLWLSLIPYAACHHDNDDMTTKTPF